MQRILLVAPAVEPVLPAEAKAHLRVDGDHDDDLIGALLVAARVAVETDIRRVMIAQTWRAIAERWPAGGLVLPVGPVLEIEAVRGVDTQGAEVELPEEAYELEVGGGVLRLHPPVPRAARFEIDFVAGFGPSGLDVPQPLRQAIRLLVTHWYENRSAAIVGDPTAELPFGYRELVAPYRRLLLC